MCVIIPNDSK